MKHFVHFLFTLSLLVIAAPLHAQCNGDSSLCNRPYDQVCYVTTHNAFNYDGPFQFPNQTHPITQQLQDGVRALMLDVYWSSNQAVLYHSFSFLGSQPLVPRLQEIKTFLDQNPTEVVTIIFECYITATQMEDAFVQANLLTYLHEQTAGQPWPTLGDMIQTGKRLVVFTDANDTQGRQWYHPVWDFAVETDFTAYSRADFSCEYNRGDSSNSLFILNHFITQNPLGYGLIDSANAINANAYLFGRASQCWNETGKIPNFLTVDFYERGNVFTVKDALNSGLTAISPYPSPEIHLKAFPNPTRGDVNLIGLPTGTSKIDLLNLHGQQVSSSVTVNGLSETKFTIPTNCSTGIYLLRVQSEQSTDFFRIVLE